MTVVLSVVGLGLVVAFASGAIWLGIRLSSAVERREKTLAPQEAESEPSGVALDQGGTVMETAAG